MAKNKLTKWQLEFEEGLGKGHIVLLFNFRHKKDTIV